LIVESESVLLVEFDDETGLHYNLPGGGVDPGESIIEALQREVREEASVNIEVGPLLFAVEYEPNRNSCWASSIHTLSLIFNCRLSKGARPQMPDRPDVNQTAVKWIKLSELESVELLPHIADRITAYSRNRTIDRVFLEEPIAPGKIQRYLRQR
jgi:ADP-ribose pyrophosphatase YjhB (NUDIX family)